MDTLVELERVQTRILQRISDLELSRVGVPLQFSHPPSLSTTADTSTTTESRLSATLLANAVRDFSFKRVPSDYYDWALEARRDVLAAASVYHLCKSIVLNTLNANAGGGHKPRPPRPWCCTGEKKSSG